MSISPVNSTIGQKAVMAVTGVLLLLFVVGHLLGNLQMFIGPDAFNDYAAFLQSMKGPLWAARIGLLVVLVLHVVTAFSLRSKTNASRPTPYVCEATVRASLASRFMLETGILIAAFIILHLLHFTLGILQPEFAHLTDATGRHDVYSMVVYGFQNSAYCAAYVVAMLILGVHLSHGIQSSLQTIGFNHPKYTPCISIAGAVIAWAIALGYISLPLGVMFGFIGLP